MFNIEPATPLVFHHVVSLPHECRLVEPLHDSLASYMVLAFSSPPLLVTRVPSGPTSSTLSRRVTRVPSGSAPASPSRVTRVPSGDSAFTRTPSSSGTAYGAALARPRRAVATDKTPITFIMTCCVQRRAEYLKMELDKNLIMHVLRVLGPSTGHLAILYVTSPSSLPGRICSYIS